MSFDMLKLSKMDRVAQSAVKGLGSYVVYGCLLSHAASLSSKGFSLGYPRIFSTYAKFGCLGIRNANTL